MYITYILVISLCYPVLRMPSNEGTTDMTSYVLAMDKMEILEQEREKRLKQDLAQCMSQARTQSTSSEEYLSMNFCFIILYHLTSRRSTTESILATTVLFFWKVSAFPVNCTTRSDHTKEPGLQGRQLRKARSISARVELHRGIIPIVITKSSG